MIDDHESVRAGAANFSGQMTERSVEEALIKCSLSILKSAGVKQTERLALSSFSSVLSEYLLKLISDLKCICNHPARPTPNAFDFKLLFAKRLLSDARSITNFVSMRRFVCENLMAVQDKRIVSRVQDSSLPPLPPLHTQRFTKVPAQFINLMLQNRGQREAGRAKQLDLKAQQQLDSEKQLFKFLSHTNQVETNFADYEKGIK